MLEGKAPQYFIIARDPAGKFYVFGTTPNMLEGDIDRFRHCNLDRYPVGEITGYLNRVAAIETPIPMGCDEALRLFTSGFYKADSGQEVTTYKVLKELV